MISKAADFIDGKRSLAYMRYIPKQVLAKLNMNRYKLQINDSFKNNGSSMALVKKVSMNF
jgi:hypothetical protein